MNPNLLFPHVLVVIKGAGDLASGVAYRLKRAGFPIIMTELPVPTFIRRTVCYGEAIYQNTTTVEEIPARHVNSAAEAARLASTHQIPVLADPEATVIAAVRPQVVVDAIMAKENTGTTLDDAPLVIGLGPGFTAGLDCHAVVETNRGHWLGRVIYDGPAQPDSGTPGAVRGYTADRVLRAPAAGSVAPHAKIGDHVEQDAIVATVSGIPVTAPFPGILRGLVHPSVPVTPGLKIGDVDPRADVTYCFHISDKSLAVGGGVLEAILASPVMRVQ